MKNLIRKLVDMKVNLKRIENEDSLDALGLEATPVVDKVSKKRKASNSKKLQGSKRKKSKLASAKESLDLEDVENDGHVSEKWELSSRSQEESHQEGQVI
ncbi:hypothetical protein Dsin_010503 [Dipteronia sinensis]|uniref:Uncharacterized protein n=1 Tax=Dipteronia sinensis TaxID=43782 RepID=A0AAE0ECM9_9ROSI|nr:hypothetical protein Dsin_010503 [Dipteronia sinensis]